MYHISILCRTDLSSRIPTIDRRNPANQVRSVVYPTFLSGFYTQKKRSSTSIVAAKHRNFHARSFCSSSLAASLVFTKTTALERFMAESKANKVPRSAFGFFSSWKAGKMRSENFGASRTVVLRGSWECQLKL